MNSPTSTGLNRTGVAASPLDAPKTIEGAEEGVPSSAGDASSADPFRISYAREAEPVGKVPPPATAKGAVKAVVKALKGEKANVFIDKLGERLAFERVGTRLYEMVLVKWEAYGSWEGGPSREALQEIRNEELEHFGLLQECMVEIGADPTAMTPSADVAQNISKGIPAVLADPRTNLRQCLEAMLVAELADNACWDALAALARESGQEAMAARFERALEEEAEHLRKVTAWVRNALSASLEGEDAHPRPSAQPPA
jgi:ferritin-like protein